MHHLDDEYLSVTAIATALDVDERTVRRLIARGDLPAFRFGRAFRVARSDWQTFVNMRKTATA